MSLFDQNDSIDENKDYLEELIGPGGKFDVTKYNNDRDAAIKAMAKGKAHADKTLDQRNKEFDELREAFLAKSEEADKKSAEAEAKAKFEELVTRFEASKNTNQDDTNKSGIVDQPTLDPSKIEEIVANKLQEIEVKKRENDNLSVVDSRLRERFGDNAANILKEKMNTLGISNDDLKFLAKRSPEAVFNALGLNQQVQENFQAPVRGSTRNDSFSPKTTTRDAVYWEKMRKDEPKKYFSPDNSVQRLKDMDSPDFLKRYQELTKN